MQSMGNLILFGSGETTPSGRAIQRRFLGNFGIKQSIAILETPAGFQPNSYKVALEIAQVFRTSLVEYVKDVFIIPARKKVIDRFSTDNQTILKPLSKSSYIFLGPGSPTYTVKQLRNSKAWKMIVERWKKGANICFSSAGALSVGLYTLPVYEIYKSGFDLYWEKGLNIFENVGLSLSIMTHFNNREGGKDLDTRYCFMGQERFNKLLMMLPRDHVLLGIDEHTAVIFDFYHKMFWIDGLGKATLKNQTKEIIFKKGKYYKIESFTQLQQLMVPRQSIVQSKVALSHKYNRVFLSKLPKKAYKLMIRREYERRKQNFIQADKLRVSLARLGYVLEDTESGTSVYKN